MSLEPQLELFIKKIQKKIDDNSELKNEIRTIKKIVNVDFNVEQYYFIVDYSEIGAICPGINPEADITIFVSPDNFEKLLTGELHPMRAYVTKKITYKGDVRDLMYLKKYL